MVSLACRRRENEGVLEGFYPVSPGMHGVGVARGEHSIPFPLPSLLVE